MQNIADNLLSAPQMEILRLRLVIVIARVWCMATSGARSVPGPHSLYPLLMVTPCDQAAADTREGK